MTTEMKCPVCLDDLSKKKKIAKTCCNHSFCEKCLEKWLEVSSACPVCRGQVDSYQAGKKKVKPSPPKPAPPSDDLESLRLAFELQHGRLNEEAARTMLGLVGDFQGVEMTTFIRACQEMSHDLIQYFVSMLSILRIEDPEIFEHQPGAFPIGCYDSLLAEVRPLWKKVKGRHHKTLTIYPEDLGKFPTIKLITESLDHSPGRLETISVDCCYSNTAFNPRYHIGHMGRVEMLLLVGDNKHYTKGSFVENTVHKFEDGDVVLFSKSWLECHQLNFFDAPVETYGAIFILLSFT